MDPPIQEPYLLSWGPLAAISLNLMVDGVLILRSLLSRSLKPLRQVFPAQSEIKITSPGYCKSEDPPPVTTTLP